MQTKVKQPLYNAVREAYPRVYFLDEAHAYCHRVGAKESTGEKKLRELRHSGLIERVPADETKPVQGYLYIPPPTAIRSPAVEQAQRLFELKRPSAVGM